MQKEALRHEPEHFREAQLPEDTALVHVIETGDRVVSTRTDVGVTACQVEFLDAASVLAHDVGMAESVHDDVTKDPHFVDAQTGAAWRTILELPRDPLYPQIRRLKEVIIHRDDRILNLTVAYLPRRGFRMAPVTLA